MHGVQAVMRYSARVLDAQEHIHVIELQAPNTTEARAQLVARGYTVLALTDLATHGQRGPGQELNILGHALPALAHALRTVPQALRTLLPRPSGSPAHAAPRFDVLLFAQELLALLTAGLNVVEALDALLERAVESGTRPVLLALREALTQGLRFSVALAQHPQVFSALFVGVMQAAEGTSDVAQTLERYVAYEARLRNLRHIVVSAATYPAVLLVAGLLVAGFLLGYVVPRFAVVYQGSGRALPWASQLLLETGAFIAAHGGVVALTAAMLLGFGAWGVRHAMHTGQWRVLLRGLPGLRARIDRIALSRFYLTLGMLLDGGIALVRAMHLSAAVLPMAQRQRLGQAVAQVSHGDTLSNALERADLVTSVSLRLLRVGEKSGQLGAMLGRMAAYYDTDTTRWIERTSKVFEPLLMAAIGVVIGAIVILLYMPIFDLAGSLP
jgi:general secretion pathway protein F